MSKTLLAFAAMLAACSPSPSNSKDAGPSDSSSNDPGVLKYVITNLTGTYGGSDVDNQSSTYIDTFAPMTCTATSSGTTANQSPTLVDPAQTFGLPSSNVAIDVTHSCPSGSATSTVIPPCTVSALSATGPFIMQLVADGWNDASVITITTMGAAPGGVTQGCNYASVIEDTGHPWNVVGTTTVGNFRGTAPFDVHFQGSQTLTWLTDTSNVEWDFTITFQPTN